MVTPRAFITGLGLVCAAGKNVAEVLENLRAGRSGLGPLTLFPTSLAQPPIVGQARGLTDQDDLQRTRNMALMACLEATSADRQPLDAIVLGLATGGVTTLEEILKSGPQVQTNQQVGAASVGRLLARRLGCRGPIITISTACSSSAVALKAALELIRGGLAKRVLCCGAEALSRLTVYGFHLLQLLDPIGTRPLDAHRAGMTLGEGAGALLLIAADKPPAGALAELRGAGLTCDAHHPIAPHPEGLGAAAAMRAALKDAGLTASQIDYLNLHGTGTQDNDAAEAAAIVSVFGSQIPWQSSTKGIFGHTTAAAGAVEAVVSVLAIVHGFVPPNVGLETVDPGLGLNPVKETVEGPIGLVLSNSFGFGGNNASVVIGRPNLDHPGPGATTGLSDLAVLGWACLTGAGDLAATWEAFRAGTSAAGQPVEKVVTRGLEPRTLRRLRRLPRLTLSLASSALTMAGPAAPKPAAVYFGTGRGTTSETHSFLKQLFESNEQFSSPVDFMGSVHNAPAGHVAMLFKAQGANITTWGGQYAFEQALLLAGLMGRQDEGEIILIGADEADFIMTPAADPEAGHRTGLVDGGGGLIVRPTDAAHGLRLRLAFFENGAVDDGVVSRLIDALGGKEKIHRDYGAILVGLPATFKELAQGQLDDFLRSTAYSPPIINYRELLGDFPTASAAALVMGVEMIRQGAVPDYQDGRMIDLDSRGLLWLSLGEAVAAVGLLT